MTSLLHRSFHAWMLCILLALSAGAAAQAPAPSTAACTDCGVVQSVRRVEQKGQASGVGAIAGGVVGGVIGHQFGSGRGNTAATIAGAGAGAYAGHQVEKSRNKRMYWSVQVRMDNGSTRQYSFNNKPEFRQGDRVKALDEGRRLALVSH